MPNELLINVTPQETRISLLENKIVTELYIERAKDRGIVGNIYEGRVLRVLPGMQAAFVDIGLEKATFLYVSDVYDEIAEYEMVLRSNVDPAESNELEEELDRSLMMAAQPSQIDHLLREGQEILVQVAKEPIGNKGARITSHISLPGRHLVLMPMVDHVGISRRITDEAERTRLREIVQKIKDPAMGFIVRTVSEGVGESELLADMDFLLKLWESIQQKKENAPVPSLIHKDLSITLRAIRDLFTPDIDTLVIDDVDEYNKVLEFVETFMPQLKYRIELYDRPELIFDYYGVEVEISRSLGRKIWLKSGGYIVIEQTEALTSIDVNTGKFVGKRNLEDTILKTNLEAVKEIASQLRLRNIGGLIVIDFIDMEKDSSREKVYSSLVESLRNDKHKTHILKFSELGLVEMTRKRIRENLGRTLCEPCNYCEGSGYHKSNGTVCYEIFREIKREISEIKGDRILLNVNPIIADALFDEERDGIEALEHRYNKHIIIKVRDDFHIEQFEINGI
jgi:ribonuclease G